MQGDAPKARAAYQDFLTLWKNADPGIPGLRPARRSTPLPTNFSVTSPRRLESASAMFLRDPDGLYSQRPDCRSSLITPWTFRPPCEMSTLL